MSYKKPSQKILRPLILLYSPCLLMHLLLVSLFLYVFFPHTLNAKEHIFSSIPVPEQEVMDVSIKKCSKSCLTKLFEEEQYFSFLALYRTTKDKVLKEKFDMAVAMLDALAKPLPPLKDKLTLPRIALMIPQKSIGRYSATSADSLLAYLIARGENFELKVFDLGSEEVANLQETYTKIQEEGFDFIITLLTPKGVGNLLQNVDNTLPIFIPTINKKQAIQFSPNKNVFFGGIDYEKQIDMILSFAHANAVPLISLNDSGAIGRMIGDILNAKQPGLQTEVIDTQKSTDFSQSLIKLKRNLAKSMVVLNTSAIKSGLIVPQIGNAKLMPIAFLSSQINYNPSLLGLMPQEDAKKLFVVNVINPLPSEILVFNELLSADLQYDWVNYATALSLDVLMTQDNKKAKRLFIERTQNNQVIYDDRFYGVQDNHFVPAKIN